MSTFSVGDRVHNATMGEGLIVRVFDRRVEWLPEGVASTWIADPSDLRLVAKASYGPETTPLEQLREFVADQRSTVLASTAITAFLTLLDEHSEQLADIQAAVRKTCSCGEDR